MYGRILDRKITSRKYSNATNLFEALEQYLEKYIFRFQCNISNNEYWNKY